MTTSAFSVATSGVREIARAVASGAITPNEVLDSVLERMENASERYGERFTPPTILRRLVAQGRLGQKSGQGFYAYPQPDPEQPAEVVTLETREDGVAIAWLANGQMNSISPRSSRTSRRSGGASRTRTSARS